MCCLKRGMPNFPVFGLPSDRRQKVQHRPPTPKKHTETPKNPPKPKNGRKRGSRTTQKIYLKNKNKNKKTATSLSFLHPRCRKKSRFFFFFFFPGRLGGAGVGVHHFRHLLGRLPAPPRAAGEAKSWGAGGEGRGGGGSPKQAPNLCL